MAGVFRAQVNDLHPRVCSDHVSRLVDPKVWIERRLVTGAFGGAFLGQARVPVDAKQALAFVPGAQRSHAHAQGGVPHRHTASS